MSHVFTRAIVGRLRAISFGFQSQQKVPGIIDGEVSTSLFSPVARQTSPYDSIYVGTFAHPRYDRLGDSRGASP
jgi:hypothetical protein